MGAPEAPPFMEPFSREPSQASFQESQPDFAGEDG